MSEHLERALFSYLKGDGPLTALLSGDDVYADGAVPAAATLPYVVTAKQAGSESYHMGPGGNPIRGESYLVKGITKSRSRLPGLQIAERVRTILTDAQLSLSPGWVLLYLRSESDVDYSERDGDVTIWHIGQVWRAMTQEAA